MFELSHQKEQALVEKVAKGMILVSIPTFFVLRYVMPSPWGKTILSKQRQSMLGPLFPPRLSWFLFECPNLYWSFVCWKETRRELDIHTANQVLLSLFVLHYIQRAILYPLILSTNTKPIPFAVVLSAFLFCNVNGYLQAQTLCRFESFPSDWIYSPQFIFGTTLFFIGMTINIQSDAILRRLRRASSTYQIPKGGLFEYVSAPHYFGEVIEWIGFAVASDFSLASCAFVVFTASNLVPRAMAHHAWYQSAFASKYPVERRAIIPFIW